MTRWEIVRQYLTSEEQVAFIVAYTKESLCAQQDLNEEINLPPHHVLQESFTWGNSPDGHLYWYMVYQRIAKSEGDPYDQLG